MFGLTQLVRTIGIELTVEDQESIYNHFELNRDGLLDFQKVNPIIVDILLGHVFFHTARMERVLRSVGLASYQLETPLQYGPDGAKWRRYVREGPRPHEGM